YRPLSRKVSKGALDLTMRDAVSPALRVEM
ncbi:unnamed protein product, partial [marine sediment metagenome]